MATSLYSKYRPDHPSKMIGDFNYIFESLNKPDHPHTYLLIGNSGTGKSTLGRLMAKHLGATGFDFIEINGADYTSVDDMRDLLERTSYRPDGKAKVVFIDECHKLSPAAWELLRVPTDEPPSWLYWVFASSNPAKIPRDNRGRCSEVNFPNISEKDLFKLLRSVVVSDGLFVTNAVLAKIAEQADGSARDALVDLERVAAVSDEDKQLAMLTSHDDDNAEAIELARIVYSGQTGAWAEARTVLKKLKDNGIEAETIRRVLLNYGSSMLLNGNSKGVLCKHFAENTYDNGFAGLVVMMIKVFNL